MSKEEWEENAKFILESIKNLCANQEILFNKIDDLHSAVSSHNANVVSNCALKQEKINERFVSKWLLNVLITILISVFGVIGYSTANIYNKLELNNEKLTNQEKTMTNINKNISNLEQAFEHEKQLIYLLKLNKQRRNYESN